MYRGLSTSPFIDIDEVPQYLKDYHRTFDVNAFQFFINNYPHNHTIKEIRDFSSSNDIQTIVHGSHNIDLCYSKVNNKRDMSNDLLQLQLNLSDKFGSMGVVVHLKKGYIEDVKSNINHVLRETVGSKIIIETSPKGNFNRLEDLALIFSVCQEKDRLGICLDTCHSFAAGYNLTSSEDVRDFFSEFQRLIGMDKLKLVHLNDNLGKLGSRDDRHADLTYGRIWNSDISGLVEIYEDLGISRKVPLILETPDVMNDLVFLNELNKNYLPVNMFEPIIRSRSPLIMRELSNICPC